MDESLSYVELVRLSRLTIVRDETCKINKESSSRPQIFGAQCLRLQILYIPHTNTTLIIVYSYHQETSIIQLSLTYRAAGVKDPKCLVS